MVNARETTKGENKDIAKNKEILEKQENNISTHKIKAENKKPPRTSLPGNIQQGDVLLV